MTDFKQVYNKYSEDVFRFSLWLCANYDEAKDITSETFIRMWTARTETKTETVKAYLFTIARNLYLKSVKADKRKTVLDESIIEPSDLATNIESKSDLERTLTALQILPELERSAIAMRSFNGMSYQEISKALNISLALVKVKIHRGRIKLLKNLED
ncbi:MAG: RNA polymerase sigma factor [Calditrichaeota bacterium]|nr:RNA polymerase sigma factor [Calditrichota bacterium]